MIEISNYFFFCHIRLFSSQPFSIEDTNPISIKNVQIIDNHLEEEEENEREVFLCQRRKKKIVDQEMKRMWIVFLTNSHRLG